MFIRRFCTEDAKEVSDLIIRTMRITNTRDYPVEMMEELITHQQPEDVLKRASWTHYYVAEEDGKIIGCGAIGPYWDKEDESSLFSIFVLPECQGQGIGRAIVETLEKDDYALRAKRIEIPASITALKFYRKLGYEYKNGVAALDSERLYRLEKHMKHYTVLQITDPKEKSQIARQVLEALTDWFEVEESREEYIRESAGWDFFAAKQEGKAIGFLCLKQTGPATVELAVMGVLKEYHRHGTGRALFAAAKEAAIRAGYEFMQVKTVQMGVYEDYDQTNRFYQSLGFKELEVFPVIWGEDNPCQIYVMALQDEQRIIDIIRRRRSYRGRYKADKVPREDLKMILEAGLDAHSGCNKQTTSLIAVDDPKVLKQLFAVIDPPVGESAPAVICVLTQRINAYRDRCFAVQDYSAAIENMLLAITALGYRSCWYEGHITDEDRIGDKMAKILGVPAGYDLVCMLPVGIPEEDLKKDPAAPRKKPFEDRAWFNHFQNNQ